MYLVNLILATIIHFYHTVAATSLRSCWLEVEQPCVCFLGKRYVDPFEKFPVVMETKLYLQEIVDIDEVENSISLQMNLIVTWNDPDLASSNGTSV